MAACTNFLPIDSYEGIVKGAVDGTAKDVTLEWADNAKARLAQTAASYRVPPATLKAATEHLAYNCVTRLQKDRARIMGSFHNTTTNTVTGRTQADYFHITIKACPGEWKVHIYVDTGEGPTKFDNVTVKGESVVRDGPLGEWWGMNGCYGE